MHPSADLFRRQARYPSLPRRRSRRGAERHGRDSPRTSHRRVAWCLEVTAERLSSRTRTGSSRSPPTSSGSGTSWSSRRRACRSRRTRGCSTRVADLGERLLHLHTYGERFVAPDRPPGVRRGEARNTKAVGDPLPEGHSYDPDKRVLHVGEGEFAPVSPEVYGYSVSGLPRRQVVAGPAQARTVGSEVVGPRRHPAGALGVQRRTARVAVGARGDDSAPAGGRRTARRGLRVGPLHRRRTANAYR